MEEVNSFQEAYKNRSVVGQKFLETYPGAKPNYDEQIRTGILYVMENPPNSMKPAEFKDRKGDRVCRLIDNASAEAELLNVSSIKPKSKS